MRFATICLALLLAVLPAMGDEPVKPLTPSSARPFVGQVVVRVSTTTAEQLARVEALSENIWSERVGIGPIEIQIKRDRLDDLEALGLIPVILVEDLQLAVDLERKEIERVRANEAARHNDPILLRADTPAHNIRFWDSYRDRSEIEAYLFNLASAYPDMATLQQIGSSIEGRPIWAVLISAPDTPANPRDQRAVVQWNGTQHAREWISPMTVLYLADQLLQRSESSPRVAGLLATIEFAIVPITNPDGYDYTWTDYRFWRKNRRDNLNDTFGVDLNRNWSYEWGGAGSSGSPSNNTYRGTHAFSEPETHAVKTLALSFGDRFAGGIDYHSYGELILWPWGYTDEAQLPEPERTIITDLAIDMSSRISDVSGRFYYAEKASDLYPVGGSADDWYQSTPGFGLTIELRNNHVFDPSSHHVSACAIENFEAALLFAEGVTSPVRISPTHPLPLSVSPGVPIVIETRILDATGTLNPDTPTLHVRFPSDESEVAIPMLATGPSTFGAEFTAPNERGRIEMRVSASSTEGVSAVYPAAGTSQITIKSDASQILLSDDFESDTGWTVGSPDDDATEGLWERGDPGADPNHPEQDTTPSGTDCYITGLDQRFNVRNGYTSLVSPTIAVPAHPGDVIISVDLWRKQNRTEPMLVQLAPDGTEGWVTVERYWDEPAAWRRIELRVNDHIHPEASFRVRFVAMDLSGQNTVECAVDGFEAVFAPAPSLADLNGDGVLDMGDISAFVSAFLDTDPESDFNHDGIIDQGDISAFVVAFLLG